MQVNAKKIIQSVFVWSVEGQAYCHAYVRIIHVSFRSKEVKLKSKIPHFCQKICFENDKLWKRQLRHANGRVRKATRKH
jgi:hypothetical protein